MAEKPLITTTVIAHGEETPYVFADAITNGKITRDGTNVREQLLRGDTVSGNTADGFVTIPYHSVALARVDYSSTTYTKPEDEFCVGGDN